MRLLAAAGGLSLLAQVVILRELVAALFGVELLYVVALGAWLAGTALGAAAGRRWTSSPRGLAAAFAALGACTLAVPALIRTAGVLVGAVPGAFLPFPVQLAGIVAATMPPAALCGLLFPPLVRRAAARGLPPARAYAWECAGAAAGGITGTALLWWGLSTLQVALLTFALALIAAAFALPLRRAVAASFTGLVAVPVVVASLVLADRWDAALLRWQYPSLVAARDTPYSRVVVTGANGQWAVFQNGALAFETEGTAAEGFADLAALQHPRPARALVLGGGTEGVGAALLPHGFAAIDIVEVDERADRLVRSVMPQQGRARTGPAAMRVIYAEPRRFLESASTYDVVLVAMPAPTSGEASRFYTREFFALCRAHLSPDGVLAIRLPAAENFWPPPLTRLVATIVRAMALELPHVSLVPGATLYVFGSAAALPGTADPLVARLEARPVTARVMTPPYLRYVYESDRRAEVATLLASAGDVGANRDAAPVCYRYAATLWLSKFYPQVAASGVSSAAWRRWPVAAVLGALLGAAAAGLWWARRTAGRASAALMFLVAGATMALESVLLLRYQIANGVMFVNVGWLLTCFMIGLTAGAWRGAPASPHAAANAGVRRLLLLLAALSLAVLVVTRVAPLAGLAGTSVLLAVTGLVAGRAFGLLTAARPGEPSRTASSMYAADVAGGAAGAWLSMLLVVPVFGLDGTALLCAAAAVALLPLGLTRGSARR